MHMNKIFILSPSFFTTKAGINIGIRIVIALRCPQMNADIFISLHQTWLTDMRWQLIKY